MSGGGDQEEDCIVKLRGLPWSATTDDIIKFFNDCIILGGKSGVHMTTSREGRPSGEAFVEFQSGDDVNRAVKRDRDHMGNRYIEVFKVNRAEMDWVIKRSCPMNGSDEDGCVRLRGLPFGCSKEEIAQFFTGLEIVPNGITLLTDCSGRSSGEAYVQFVNKEVAEKALLKHREKIGHRYIEIFRSSLSEVHGVLGINSRRMGTGNSGPGMGYNSRPSPYDRGDRYGNMNSRFQPRGSRSFKGAFIDNGMSDRKFSDFGTGGSGGGGGGFDNLPSSWVNNANHNGGDMGGGGSRSPYGGSSWSSMDNQRGGASGVHCVHMRGLPFKANQMDIADFFRPVIPVAIRLLQDNSGRASGEADVEFGSHEDAMRAMSKDKGHMQHRYIELFLNSSPNGGGSGGGLGNMSSGGGVGGNNSGGYLNYSGYGGPGRRRY